MFDPTVFDNLKVVLEGAIYDLDLNENEHIEIIDRSDTVDLAKMSRSYSISLSRGKVESVIELSTDALNWSGEILAPDQDNYPCQLYVEFLLKITDVNHDCSAIRFRLNQIWKTFKPKIEQNISFLYGDASEIYDNQIILSFKEEIDESFIIDIPFIIECALNTLEALEMFAHQ
ncbi:hypothetical protein JOD43_000621 [Pullulanibacillus pueri]|uniref:Uncharacterized protein n=1 Tax=Pullulanibacillus pueri TaxID=1437324 RepID=A0A8J2ZRX3_9BACL|nr:hypothetical protein [Pullulanibacillus pueri]MBM7680462.1 hypothetical protein [Pullulanibacillus pueri]GGH74969.1 hypothetical protein GCM10007096_03700 [Pullulanibacillus pueri]